MKIHKIHVRTSLMIEIFSGKKTFIIYNCTPEDTVSPSDFLVLHDSSGRTLYRKVGFLHSEHNGKGGVKQTISLLQMTGREYEVLIDLIS